MRKDLLFCGKWECFSGLTTHMGLPFLRLFILQEMTPNSLRDVMSISENWYFNSYSLKDGISFLDEWLLIIWGSTFHSFWEILLIHWGMTTNLLRIYLENHFSFAEEWILISWRIIFHSFWNDISFTLEWLLIRLEWLFTTWVIATYSLWKYFSFSEEWPLIHWGMTTHSFRNDFPLLVECIISPWGIDFIH